jgi:membrane-bound ClpP family serine protease
VLTVFAASGTLLIVLGFYGFLVYGLEIGVIETLLVAGMLLVGWQLRNNIWRHQNKR